VVNLHIGSSGTSPSTTDDAPPDVVGVLFFAYAISAAVDWLYSASAGRYRSPERSLSFPTHDRLAHTRRPRCTARGGNR